MLSRTKMRKLISAGRAAIEYRMLGVIVRPRDLTDADQAEMDELLALLKKYNELMADYNQPLIPADAANQANGGQA